MAKKKVNLLKNIDARNLAVNTLLLFERRQQRLSDSLEEFYRISSIDSRERRLAREIASGACRAQITLDHIIGRYSSRPLRKVDPLVRQILRVGLYQMIYLSGTPDFAAVHEAVEQVRQIRITGAGTFVNAVLRAIQRDMDGPVEITDSLPPRSVLYIDETKGCRFNKPLLPDPSKNRVKHLSVALGYPPWLIERWLKQHGESTTRSIALAQNRRPALTLRINTLHCSPAELFERFIQANIETFQAGPALQLRRPASPQDLPGYAEGEFSVQDATAMSVAPLLKPRPGQRILDLCAAPGGKTTHLAELMENQGLIVACDINAEKLNRLRENCRRLGITLVQTTLPDELERIFEQSGPFDAVLVDAPCSNTGVLARRIEVRHWLKPAHLPALARQQSDLLDKAVRLIKKSGNILYSTCSIDPMENEHLIRKFLERHPDRRLIEQKQILPIPSSPSTPPESPFSESSFLESPIPESLPYYDGGYIALLGPTR